MTAARREDGSNKMDVMNGQYTLIQPVLDLAVRTGARVAVLPCCHEVGGAPAMLEGWMDPALAQDIDRAQRLAGAGYDVWTQLVPPDITPKNRLLVGAPPLRTAPPAR